jgi:hypothetical protein
MRVYTCAQEACKARQPGTQEHSQCSAQPLPTLCQLILQDGLPTRHTPHPHLQCAECPQHEREGGWEPKGLVQGNCKQVLSNGLRAHGGEHTICQWHAYGCKRQQKGRSPSKNNVGRRRRRVLHGSLTQLEEEEEGCYTGRSRSYAATEPSHGRIQPVREGEPEEGR